MMIRDGVRGGIEAGKSCQTSAAEPFSVSHATCQVHTQNRG
jgi:hypothetical protein